jgi:aspartyl protease family protein
MMGHVNVKLKLANPVSPSATQIEMSALVDTGATFTTIPRHVAEKLGLRITGKRTVRTATKLETLEQSFASVEINSNLTVTPILVSDTLDKILVGVITLEALGLAVDPTTGQLKEAETYLL